MTGRNGVGSSDGRRGLLRLHSCRVDGAYLVSLAGELDLASMDAVERELQRGETADPAVIVLDLRELSFMDATGVRVIVRAHRRVGDRLVIVKGPRPVQRLLEICGLVERLPLVDAPPAAVASASRRDAVARRINQATLAAAVRELRGQRRAGSGTRRPSG
jgi:anti-anti-sigma factor